MKQIREEYRTGIGQIDEEHAGLLELTERAKKLLEDENMLFKCADIRKILEGLKDYTVVHFTHEEAFMESIGYGGIEEQKKQHRLFVQKLEEFTDRVSRLSLGTQDDMILELFQYLEEWLQSHIRKEDMKYVRFSQEKTETMD